MTDAKKHAISEPVTIWSEGTRLAGDLWSLPDTSPDAPVPGVLLCHGYGGRREQLNGAYGRKFAALGFVVLTFDYRGYGDSDGKLIRVGDRPSEAHDEPYETRVQEVREVVDVLDQVEDARSALAFLMGDPRVDPNRIAVWGSSNGGGVALDTACSFPEHVKVLITQVGSVNPQHILRQYDAGASVPNADRMRSWQEAWQERIALARGDKSPFLKPVSAAGSPERYAIRGALDWDRYRRWDPMRDVEALDAATLIIDAEDEELFDRRHYGPVLLEAIRERVPASYEIVAGTHYDIYSGDGYRKALALEKEWLAKHLPG
jgi:dienelactone hydrolase